MPWHLEQPGPRPLDCLHPGQPAMMKTQQIKRRRVKHSQKKREKNGFYDAELTISSSSLKKWLKWFHPKFLLTSHYSSDKELNSWKMLIFFQQDKRKFHHLWFAVKCCIISNNVPLKHSRWSKLGAVVGLCLLTVSKETKTLWNIPDVSPHTSSSKDLSCSATKTKKT